MSEKVAKMVKKVPGTAEIADSSEKSHTPGNLDDFSCIFSVRNPQNTRLKALARLKMAESEAARTTGLSSVDALEPNSGMFFTKAGAFWMPPSMKFPLEILFLDGKGKILEKQAMPLDQGKGRYQSFEPKVAHAVELPLGFCDRHGIEVGDVLAPCGLNTEKKAAVTTWQSETPEAVEARRQEAVANTPKPWEHMPVTDAVLPMSITPASVAGAAGKAVTGARTALRQGGKAVGFVHNYLKGNVVRDAVAKASGRKWMGTAAKALWHGIPAAANANGVIANVATDNPYEHEPAWLLDHGPQVGIPMTSYGAAASYLGARVLPQWLLRHPRLAGSIVGRITHGIENYATNARNGTLARMAPYVGDTTLTPAGGARQGFKDAVRDAVGPVVGGQWTRMTMSVAPAARSPRSFAKSTTPCHRKSWRP